MNNKVVRLLRLAEHIANGMLHARDQQHWMSPLYPCGCSRIGLVRDALLSPCDPVALAVDAVAELTVLDHLPESAQQLEGFQGLIVLARTANSAGLTAADVQKALAAKPIPLLWIVQRIDGLTQPSGSSAQPVQGPVPVRAIADFVRQVPRSE